MRTGWRLPGTIGTAGVEIKSWSHQARTAQLFVDPQWFSLGADDGEFDGPPEAVIARVAKRLSDRGMSLQQRVEGVID